MSENKKRKKPQPERVAEVPAKQRTSGHLLWAVLFAVFGVLIVLFSMGNNWVALIIGAAVGAVAGWLLGRKMEQDARNK